MFPFDSVTAHWVGLFLCSEDIVLEDPLVFLVLFALQDNMSHGILSSWSLNRQKSALLKSKLGILIFALLLSGF